MHITIITPNFNYGRFLQDCLQSIADQLDAIKERQDNESRKEIDQSRKLKAESGKETDESGMRSSADLSFQLSAFPISAFLPSLTIEHLVIDAGSTDHSAEVAARFPHVTWLQEPDQGMSDAINKGFDRAKGEWVMWLNADDRLKPNALLEISNYLQSSPADIVYGNWDFIDEQGHFLRHVKSLKWSRFIHIHHHCYIGSTAAFYRKSTVIDAGHRLRDDFHYVMDGEFYARLDRDGKQFHYVPVTVADFRLHGHNASQRHLGIHRNMETTLAAERQHIESRAIRRAYGITLFADPYLNGLVDGLLWIAAKAWKGLKKSLKV